MPLNKQDMHLFVFDPTKKATISTPAERKVMETIVLDGEWAFELKPTLNNEFGDFHWPATPQMLGAYIYKARYNQSFTPTDGWQSPSFDDSDWTAQTFTFGSRFMLLEATPDLSEELIFSNLPGTSAGVVADNKEYRWKPYEYSWRWGVENDYGHQGWHGPESNRT